MAPWRRILWGIVKGSNILPGKTVGRIYPAEQAFIYIFCAFTTLITLSAKIATLAKACELWPVSMSLRVNAAYGLS